MRTFGLVFVLFNPDEVVLANLAHAHAQCAMTVVVDNTPQPDPGLHATLRSDGLVVIDNRNEGGLAGAYNRGLEHLTDHGVEVCFLLDQDSQIPSGFFERMTAATASIDGEDFLVGPLVYETRMDRYFPDLTPASPGDAATPLQPTMALISSGSAVSASAYRRLGPFDERLFIECVDIEYAVRATQEGVPLLVNRAEILRQQTGAITQHGRWFTTNHVAWRRYYLVRNVIAVGRTYARPWKAILRGVGMVVRELFLVMRFERDKRAKVVAILIGLVDGLRMRLGRFEDRHPRAHRYCVGQGSWKT